MSYHTHISELQNVLNNVWEHLEAGLENGDWTRIQYAFELLTGEEAPSPPEDESPDLTAILARLEKLESQPKANTRKTPAKKKATKATPVKKK